MVVELKGNGIVTVWDEATSDLYDFQDSNGAYAFTYYSMAGQDTINADCYYIYIESPSAAIDITTSAVEGIIYGGVGDDIVRITSGQPGVYVDVTDGNDMVIRGKAGSGYYSMDILIPTKLGAGADTLYGGSFGDLVHDLDGHNVLYGFRGNDDFWLTGENNQVYGGRDNDKIYGGASGGFYGGSGEDRMHLGARNQEFADMLIDGGSGSDDIYVLSLGQATIRGGQGGDGITVDIAEGLIDGGDGSDYISVGEGNHTVKGGNGHDSILTVWGNQKIFGGSGNDIIMFGSGQDTVAGGSGADRFEMHGYLKKDVITDFGNGDDILVFVGSRAKSFIGADAFNGTKGEVRYDQTKGILSGDNNGDGVADWSIKLANKAALTADDFLFG